MSRHGRQDDPTPDDFVAAARREAEAWRDADSTLEETEAADRAPVVPGYRVLGEIHRGGQGVVYRAVQERTKRVVALKVLHGGPLAGPRERLRFEREVQLLASLDHPGIVTVHDTGEADGGFYLVMDHIAGLPLDRYVAARRPPLRELLTLFARICDAVHAAHLHGVIHRDLKPSNIRVDDDGAPHVLDFGLAKTTLRGDADVTETGQFVGSLPYASPEQAAGHATIDIRTDVYSLGVVLHVLLTGELPIDVSGSLEAVLDRIARVEPTPPDRHRPDIDDDVSTITVRCLAKDRERRYQSAGELARDVRRYLDGLPIEAKRDSAWYVAEMVVARHKVPIVVAVLFLVVLTAGFLVSFVQWHRAEQEAERARGAERRALEAQAAAETRGAELSRRGYYDHLLAAEVALEDGNTAHVKALLAESPTALRGWEWRRLSWLADRSRRRFRVDGARATAVAIRGDGGALAWGDSAGSVVVIDVASGVRRADDPRHAGSVRSIAWSESGTRTASCGADGTVSVGALPPAAGSPTGEPPGAWSSPVHGRPAVGAVFVAGDRLVVSAGEDGTVVALDAATGAESWRARPAPGESLGAIAAGGGELVVGTSSGAVVFLDPASGAAVRRLAVTDDQPIAVLALHGDSGRVAVGAGGRVRILRLPDGRPDGSFAGHGEWIHAVTFSRDGLFLLSAGADHTVKLHRASDLELLRTWRGHTDRVFGVDFFPDALGFATASLDGTVRLWDRNAPDQARAFPGPRAQVWDVAFLENGRRFVAAGSDGAARLYDRRDVTGVPVILGGHRGAVLAVAIDRSRGRIVTADATGRTRCFDARDGAPIATWDDVDGWLHRARIDGDGTLWTLGADRTIRRRDLDSGAGSTTTRLETTAVAMDVSADGRTLFVGSVAGTVARLDASHGTTIWSTSVHTGTIWDVALSPDARTLVTAGADRRAVLLDAETGAVVRTLEGHRNGVRCLAWSPDGRRVATGSWDWTVKVWDADHGDLALTLRGHDSRVESLAWSPDGDSILTGAVSGAILLFDTIPETEVKR